MSRKSSCGCSTFWTFAALGAAGVGAYYLLSPEKKAVPRSAGVGSAGGARPQFAIPEHARQDVDLDDEAMRALRDAFIQRLDVTRRSTSFQAVSKFAEWLQGLSGEEYAYVMSLVGANVSAGLPPRTPRGVVGRVG